MRSSQRRRQASQDIEDIVDYYLQAADPDTAERFLVELDLALQHILRQPGTGSRRYASLLDGPDLRFWTLSRFPYSVFYLERGKVIDILRVLHQATDIPRHLAP